MRIVVLTDAACGASTVVDANGTTWPAVWSGESPAKAGAEYDVELELNCPRITANPTSVDDGVGSTASGIRVCGSVSAIFDDGVLALDIGSATLLLDNDDVPGVYKVGDALCLEADSISIFPTGL
ncbi:hypothetical protein FEK35_08420 [Nocardia cyriacigeorgica]|uniref:Uncharacterized protein n=1 Tax=Nocardia cyriacigeorgica TaxID=135487 RepID=A0A5R8PHV5_9NOCA|nr:hypothetical protein [Nocardia cyriacigeorgica]TLG14408.1 hypothetical protein FEK35_08420 [Nocardia cyriacigeorgica]